MEQLFGVIERITFHNEENGFTVAKLKTPRKSDLITLVGCFPLLQPGEQVRCTGDWKNVPSHGMQFQVETCQIDAPQDLVGIRKFLESGMIRGIGPVYAEKIVHKFGLSTLEIIDKTPHQLLSIPGLGEKKIEKIKKSWEGQKTIREVMIFLQKYGVTAGHAQRIYRHLGQDAIIRIQENPYELAKEITGMGFKTADAIASKLGFLKESNLRLDAGIDFVLQELSSEGHVCYPLIPFVEKTAEMLGAEKEKIEERLPVLKKEERIFLTEELIWSKGLYLSEKGIAAELKRLHQQAHTLRTIDASKAVEWAEKTLNIHLGAMQKEAIKKSIIEKIHIITGGQEQGKARSLKPSYLFLDILLRGFLLAAPTGRAAKRMTEITGHGASTIHSLLQYDFNERGFRRNRNNPLDCDLLIVDESSMIDTWLMDRLLKAVPSTSKLILVGDVYQLPSVGPGSVLKDLIGSEKIPTTQLSEIFRQAAGSKIITNAHKINEGEFPDLRVEEKGDFFFVKAEESQEVLETIVDLVHTRLPKRYGFHSIEDIQVLAPMKKGPIGTENLNLQLQQRLNPQKEAIQSGGRRFAIGDKVMQTRNQYTKEVYNGDIGRIKKIDPEEKQLTVLFDEREIIYDFFELDDLVLAYAISIHKSQGSEYPCIVIPVSAAHYVMLMRNLLYTGVTRGKKCVVLVGTAKAIGMAVSNDEVKKRFTFLKERIQDLFGFN